MEMELNVIHKTSFVKMVASISFGGIGTVLLGVLLFPTAIQVGGWLIGFTFLPFFAGIYFGLKSKKLVDFPYQMKLRIEESHVFLMDSNNNTLESSPMKKLKVKSAFQYISTRYGRGYQSVIKIGFPNLQKPLQIGTESGEDFSLKGGSKFVQPEYNVSVSQFNKLAEIFNLKKQ